MPDMKTAALQNLLFQMALAVKGICERHGIPYFLIAGSLLGAVRHRDFIPWDDDMDIGMLRADYDRFIAIARDELPPELFLQTWETDPGHGLLFAKLRRNGTRFVPRISRNVREHKGIYLDIFPFENLPDGRFLPLFQLACLKTAYKTLLCRCGYDIAPRFSGNLRHRLAQLPAIVAFLPFPLLARLLPGSFLKAAITRILETWKRHEGSRRICCVNRRETLPRAWFSSLVDLPFRDTGFPCPAEYHAYLSSRYGTYMEPPPESLRHDRRHVVEYDLGDS